MAEPTSREEYERRFQENHKVSGFGTETTVSFPCPFCSAAGFLTARILDVEAALGQARTCAECGRGSKGIVVRDGGGMRLEMVQTGGPDPASWLPPMRRVAP